MCYVKAVCYCIDEKDTSFLYKSDQALLTAEDIKMYFSIGLNLSRLENKGALLAELKIKYKCDIVPDTHPPHPTQKDTRRHKLYPDHISTPFIRGNE